MNSTIKSAVNLKTTQRTIALIRAGGGSIRAQPPKVPSISEPHERTIALIRAGGESIRAQPPKVPSISEPHERTIALIRAGGESR
jgi:hypothetical protein